MRVRITVPYRDRFGSNHKVGDEVEYSDHLAAKLIGRGVAVPAPAPVIEAAVVAPRENTAKRVSKPKPKARKSSTPAKEEAE